jgi:hypothetical protein
MDWMRVPAYCALLLTPFVLAACAGSSETQVIQTGATQAPSAAVQPVPVADPVADEATLAPWLGRIQTNAKKNDAGKPDVGVSTVQPLLQTADKRDTLFTDLRANGNQQQPGEPNARSNVGLGYRRLIGKDLMAGVGGFYDRDLVEPSQRASAEGELTWNSLNLGASYYFGLDGAPQGSETTGRALDGYQVRLASPLPYLPWAKASVADSDFFLGGSKDSHASRTTTMQIGLMRNLQLDAGVIRDSLSDDSEYVKLSIRFDGNGWGLRRYLFSSEPVAPVAFEARDLTGATLDKVSHNEDIVRDY